MSHCSASVCEGTIMVGRKLHALNFFYFWFNGMANISISENGIVFQSVIQTKDLDIFLVLSLFSCSLPPSLHIQSISKPCLIWLLPTITFVAPILAQVTITGP